MFSKSKIYRVSLKGQEQERFTKIVLSEDTQYGMLLELAIQEPPMSETDNFKSAGILEYRFLHEINLTCHDEDNEEVL